MSHARTLVTSYCFPPYREATAVTAAKRVRELAEPVDVVCNAMDAALSRDPSLTSICGDLVRRFAAVPSPTSYSSWPGIRSYVEMGYRTALRWEDAQGPYQRLYSRAQFAASHFLAARYKASHPDVEWIAEFSDPLSVDTLGGLRRNDLKEDALSRRLRSAVEAAGFSVPANLNTYQWCEAIVFALADEIIFTNSLQRQLMLDACHDPALALRAREHSVVAPHPVLPRSFYSLQSCEYTLAADRVNIGYFGRFYVNRGIGLVLDALRGLPDEVLRHLRLHIFTSAPDEVTGMVAGSRLDQAVVASTYLNYLEFLSLADRMDVLLVNDAVTSEGAINPYLPSKWSDYKGSCTPVWAITEEGSTLHQEAGFAYHSPIGHVSAVQQTLTELAAGRRSHDAAEAMAR